MPTVHTPLTLNQSIKHHNILKHSATLIVNKNCQEKKGRKTMARVRMVTRTINTTVVHALIVNPTTKEVKEDDITIAGTYADAKALDKALSKLNTEESHIVSVYDTKVVSRLYGMTEQDFVANAKVISKEEAGEGEEAEESTAEAVAEA